MNAVSMASDPIKPPAVTWKVVGFYEAVYQSCPGAPVQAGGCCENCGMGIRYVVRMQSSTGTVMEVGQDCAVTMAGGVELAAIRRAERAYRHEQWLASPEYAEQMTKEARLRAESEARKAVVETEQALFLFGLRAIKASPNCSYDDRELAKYTEGRLLDGLPTQMSDKELARLGLAWVRSTMPPSDYVGSVGDKIERVALFEARIAFETAYGIRVIYKFRSAAGELFVWFTKGGYGFEIGDWLRLRGTVKGHEEYKGEKQTSLLRCNLEEL